MPPYLYWSDKVWVVGYYSYSVLKFLFWLMNSAWGIWFMDTHQIWRELKRPFRIFKNLPFLWHCFIDLKCYWSIPMSKLSEDTNFIMINLFTTKHFWNIFLVLGHFWLFSSLYCHRKSPSEAIMSQTFSLVQSRGRFPSVQFSSVQSLSRVWLFATPWSAAHQASLSITNSRSFSKLVSTESDAIQPSHPLPSPSPPAFSLSQHQALFKWVHSSHQVDPSDSA